jgi:hypothetical protein
VAVTERVAFTDLDPATYVPHRFHHDDRMWPETNCYVDLWIEVLHALHLDPAAPLPFLLSSDFDGEQWEFFKYPLEDLHHLYGIDVHEMNLWLPIEEHIERHLQLGHLLTIEADSWFLPDTAGVSYRLDHQKSSICPQMIDRTTKHLGYFHNRGYHELSGDDYDGVLQVGRSASVLPPYAELVDVSRLRRPDDVTLRARVDELVVHHLARRPESNPIDRLEAQILADVAWLRMNDQETFHGYAFATLRQCGAWAELAASFVGWLSNDSLRQSAEAFSLLSETAKACQFKLARAARGKESDMSALFETMSSAWHDGYQPLIECYGGR